MMLQLLSGREYGLDPPWLLPRVYGSYRFAQLELSRKKEVARAHAHAVNSMDIDSEGRYLISGSADATGSVVIHDTRRPIGEMGTFTCPVIVSTYGTSYVDDTSHAISVVRWYPHDTGIFTTSSGDKQLKIWDTNELMVVERFKFTKPLYTHAMSITTAHSLTAVGGGECKITLCDLQSGSATHALECHRKPVMALAWSPRNDYVLASGSQDNQVVLWDIRRANGPLLSLDQHNGGGASSNVAMTTAHSGYVNGLCFASDGLHLVSFGTDDRLRLWDAITGKNTLVNYGRIHNALPTQTCPLTVPPPSSTLHPVVCVPVGGELMMLDMMTGEKIKTLAGHFGTVYCSVIHPLDQELYTGGSDTNILCWAPPPSKLKDLSTVSSRKRTADIYNDDWSSSDEDDG